jgi:FtsP/CotA-like multicopper oxidase with cupredoxin domain
MVILTSKRLLLRSLLIALANFNLPVLLLAQEHAHPGSSRETIATAVVKPGPARLVNMSRRPHTVEVTITAEPTRLSLVPGRSTASYSYNGRVPGPTLEVYEGDRVIVHFINKLPEATSIHWHGIHLPVESDGSPYFPVLPGKSFDYVFTPQKGTAGTYWYHPHPGHETGLQIGKGLYGAVIVRAADDPLPRSMTEKLIVLADNRFRGDGSIDFPDPTSMPGQIDTENGREGDIVFVNGQVLPTIKIRSGEVQRWRIVNASASRIYRLSIPGQKFVHVGSDGGLFEKPVEVNDIVVANSERVELLIRGTGAPGSRTVLQTLPYDRYVYQTRPKDWDVPRNLVSLEYTGEKPVAKRFVIPAVLRPIPAIDTTLATVRRVFVLQQGFINGKLHDMNRVDETAKLGAVEIWEIENLVGMDHPFHLHGFQFQVIDRDGKPEPFRSWKDTINLPKHSTARFIVRFSDFAGKWMYHCHILDHEDHGMMGVLEVK